MRVVFVIFPGLQSLDLAGPLEVFTAAEGRYRTEVVNATGEPCTTSSGLKITPDLSFADCTGDIDTLIVVGGTGTVEAFGDDAFAAWVGEAATRSRRVASVCSGAFLLARAGLLDGRRATTHWNSCDLLAELFPEVRVEPDPIFVRDDPVWTSAGVTAGIDLALAMVQDDLGAEAALSIARHLVVFVQRPGGQSQFSAQLAAQRPDHSSLRELLHWIAGNLDGDLSVAVLARRAQMSDRNFARVFRKQIGLAPAAYVEAARIEAARRLLEMTGQPIEEIARECGFGTAETMHRSFKRNVSVTPGEYRRHFQPEGIR